MFVDISKYYPNIHVWKIEKTTRETVVGVVGRSVEILARYHPKKTLWDF
jgi:hypothetical protein